MPKNLSIITSSYRWEKFLSSFFESVADQTIFSEIEIVFVSNDTTAWEKDIIERFQKKYPEHICFIEVAREPISVSMNRAILASHGEYIFNWDIDDLRTNTSIELQYKTLSSQKDVMLTYGDFLITKEFGSTKGVYIESPEFNKQDFMMSMHCGPFRAWKKIVHERIGYFDEQLRSGADFDLMVRIATVFTMKKTPWLLGYYLNANTWLSTGGQGTFFSLQSRELRVIHTRYNVYSKIDLFVPTWWYTISSLLFWGKYISLEDLGFPLKPHFSIYEALQSIFFTLKYGSFRILKYIYLFIKRK